MIPLGLIELQGAGEGVEHGLGGAGQVPAFHAHVVAEEFSHYSWSSRSIEYHRAQIRTAFGFREFSRGDEDKLAGWLAEQVCPVELREDRLRQAVLVRCRAEGIEPPGRLDRIIGSARSTFEQRFCQRTVERLPEARRCPSNASSRATGVQ